MAAAIEEIKRIIQENKGVPETILSGEIEKVTDGEFHPSVYKNNYIAFEVRLLKLDLSTYKKWMKAAEEMGLLLKETKEQDFFPLGLYRDDKLIARLSEIAFAVPLYLETKIIEDIGRKFYNLKTAEEMKAAKPTS